MRILTTLLLPALILSRLLAAEGEPAAAWTPPPPEPTPDHDWIQLRSGEWLKGEIRSVYDETMEFDSVELDLLTIDWADIQQIRSAQPMSVNIGRRQALVGMIVMEGNSLVVRGEDETTTLNRKQVVAVTLGEARELDLWSAKVSLGVNLRAGNTEQVEYNTRAVVERRGTLTRFKLEYLGNLNITNGVESANNHRANGFVDVFIDRQWFFRPIGLEYFRDPFQNVSHRLTGTTGLGYEFINTDNLTWEVSGGPGFLLTKFTDSVNDTESSIVGIAGTRFEWDITRRNELSGAYQLTVAEQTVGGLIQHGELTLENEITDRFDIDVSFIWDRISNPALGTDGNTPKKDDFRLIFSLGYDL